MTPAQHTTLLASGNPGLMDSAAAVRGLALGVLLSIPLWFAIGWAAERLATWCWAL